MFTDFLSDAAPGFGLGLHRLGVEHLFDDGKVFRQTRGAFVADARRRRRHGLRCNKFCFGRRRARGQLQEQFELRGIEGLAARAKDAPHQRVDFLPQECVLFLGGFQRRFECDDAFPQLGQFG